MTETEINVKVKVFSDPEYCEQRYGRCIYLDWDNHKGSVCGIYRTPLECSDNSHRDAIKREECKEAIKQANKWKN